MRVNRRTRILCAAAAIALAGGGVSRAQAPAPAESAGVVSYDPAFFANSRPESAYDMVLLLPGFSFDPGQEVRGFASAAGNVLIDGKRPSTKFDALSDILKRIPPSGVARIEVIRGGAPGIDMQGKTVLANVIRRSSSELVNTSDALLTKDGRVGVSTRFDYSARHGQEGVVGSLYLFYHDGDPAGHGSKNRFDASGAPISLAEAHINNPNSGVRLTGEADTLKLGGLLRLKASFLYGTNRQTEEDAVLDASGFRQDLIFSQFRIRHGEFSADYTRRLGSKAELTVLALQDLEKATNGDNARQAGSIIQSGDEGLQGETILRATLTYTGGPRWSVETGGEGAYNFLDGKSRLIIDGEPQVIPAANVDVAESRAEAFATLTWRPNPKLTVEAGSRFEISRLTVSGDANNSVRFNFPKPRLVVSWEPTRSDQLRLRLERVVGQLNFGDFVTSSSLDQGVITSGNAKLVPERDWLAEVAWDHRFWKDADVVVTLTHAALQEVVDEVPIDGFSARGNIGDGARDTADLNLSLPLRLIGMPGGRFKGEGTWIHSRVTDPTTHRSRIITNDQPFTGTATLTNDVPRLASTWRIDLASAYRYQVFRIDEIDTFRFATQLSALWEWKARPDLAFQVQVQNILGGERDRERLVFTGLRDAAGVRFKELRDIRTGPRLYVRVRKVL